MADDGDTRDAATGPDVGSAPRAKPNPESRPELTVLIPCWNAEGSIGGALDSVLEANDVDLECLVVDDGSTDATAAIVEARAAADPRVRLVRIPVNGGVSEARNRGLDAARGRWLTFLDADDRFRPGGLRTLAAATGRPGVRAVIGQQVWTDGDREWITDFYDQPDIREPGRKALATSPGLLYFVSPHAKVVPADAVADLRFRGRVLGDQPWVIRALLRAGNRIEILGDVVYEWRRPKSDEPAASITSTTRSSAAKGVVATRVASEALRSVSEEAEVTIADPGLREAFLRRYVQRLLRSDLGMHLSLALRRSDPELGLLLDGIREFLEAVPATLIGDDPALVRSIVEPPLRAWHRVVPDARPAYRRLALAARALQPSPARHASPPLGPMAFELSRRGPRGVAAAGLLLTVQAAAARPLPRVARAFRGVARRLRGVAAPLRRIARARHRARA